MLNQGRNLPVAAGTNPSAARPLAYRCVTSGLHPLDALTDCSEECLLVCPIIIPEGELIDVVL